ncbi:glypican-5-like [Tubulanus polymorphus]|uniref:glypican-5-like n=1 Tax=Tubulanus polymorphus TaxID=672921 RepID=UPI003DA4CEC6
MQPWKTIKPRWMMLNIILMMVMLESGAVLGDSDHGNGGHFQSKKNLTNTAGEQCSDDVKVLFSAVNIAGIEMDEIPHKKIHDKRMKICYDGRKQTQFKSCCTRKMEQKYSTASVNKIHKSIQESSSYLKNLIATNAAKFQDEIVNMVDTARTNTDALFVTTYKIPVEDRKPSIDALFMDLQQYLKMQDVNVHDSVAQFFDNLFPLVFHNILNDPTVTDFSKDYQECLMEIRQQVYPHPFGDAPHKLSHLLAKSLSAARIFLSGLRIALDTVNSTDYAGLEKQCGHSLTRMQLCSSCEGHARLKPCHSYCVDVMTDCLANIEHIDLPWKRFVVALSRLSSHLSGAHSLETVLLKNVHSKVDEGIMHAMEHSYKFYEKVVQRCGYPKTSRTQFPTRVLPSADNAAAHKSSSEISLAQRMKAVLVSLNSSQDFYRNMAQSLCDRQDISSKETHNCFNGPAIDSEAKSGTDSKLQAHPKKSSRKVTDVGIATTLEKLKMLTRQIRQFQEKGTQDDGVVRYNPGSGSNIDRGYTNNFYEYDDEDDGYGTSGSGSGGGNYYLPSPNNHRKIKDKNNKNNRYDSKRKIYQDPDISFDDDTGGYNEKQRNRYEIGKSSVQDPRADGAVFIASTFFTVLSTVVGFALRNMMIIG